jgi:hypothetical protein
MMSTYRTFWPLTSFLLVLILAACNIPSSGTPASTVSVPTLAPTKQAAASKPSKTGCGNPYFPDAPGSTWTFANSSNLGGVAPSTTVRTLSGQSPAGVYVKDDTTPDIQVVVHWNCKDGNMTMLQAATISATALNASLKSESADGFLIPAEITAGKTWSEKLSIQTTGATTDSNPATVEQKNDTQMDCAANGKESIQVTAGKFDAFKVTCKYTINTITTINGETGKPVSVSFDVTDWYATGVGLVKGVKSGDIESVQELTSYKIP